MQIATLVTQPIVKVQTFTFLIFAAPYKVQRTFSSVLKALLLHFKGKGAVSKQNYSVISELLQKTIWFCVKYALGRYLKMGLQATFILNAGFV